ncbi:UNVERIFIED_CONTAM: hypothetical protein Sangu_2814800 [Sesamum angustifolium]|uniref:Uncharacterized protein n=1 Tax=Sesamum angustifolium TaxID=2727405 RepID=A0AAW2IRG0_9LAMI
MRGLRKLSNFEAITPKRVKPQKQVTLTSRQMVKSTGQAHTQEGRNERLIDLLLDRRYREALVTELFRERDGAAESLSLMRAVANRTDAPQKAASFSINARASHT